MRKIFTREELKEILEVKRREGQKIVFTNGCFDILHAGHVTYLAEAKKAGDILVLGLNSDSSVRALKGDKRPLIPESERALVLAALACVDYVTIFSEETPRELILFLRPDVLVKGGDWKEEDLAGGGEIKSWGGRVLLVAVVPGVSTTDIVERVKQRYGLEGMA
jgi:D-beta-D-heptose 7-phosphate kinase/D-beta-D-heptose 1-phosphate adenosyltransferase